MVFDKSEKNLKALEAINEALMAKRKELYDRGVNFHNAEGMLLLRIESKENIFLHEDDGSVYNITAAGKQLVITFTPPEEHSIYTKCEVFIKKLDQISIQIFSFSRRNSIGVTYVQFLDKLLSVIEDGIMKIKDQDLEDRPYGY